MKKIISIILTIGLIISCVSPVMAAEYSMNISAVLDPAEQKVLISGKTTCGPDSRIGAVVADADGNSVYLNECMSASDGSFKLSVNIDTFPDGDYILTLRAENTEPAEYRFTLPLPAGNAAKISAKVLGNNFFFIENNAPEEENSTITLKLANAKVSLGRLNQDDYEVTGLPEGYSIEANASSQDTIILSLQGTGAVDEVKEVSVRLKSTIISGGSANTSSDYIEGIKIYPESINKKVNLTVLNNQIKMRDARNIDSNENTVELAVTLRGLAKTGLLEKDTDYSFTMPSSLSGLKTEVAANAEEGKIRIKFTGKTDSNLKNDTQIDDFVIKSSAVTGANVDSEPVTIKVKASDGKTTGSSSSSGGSGSSGSSGGYTGGGMNITVIQPTVPVEKIEFEDCKGHWAENEIHTLAGAGVISGVGDNSFEPNRQISRAEFVTIIVRAFDIQSGSYDGTFSDVKNNDWFAGYIGKALKAGIISKDTTFRPNDPIKREEMIKVIVGAWLLENEKPQWLNSAEFADNDKVSDWAKEYLDLGVTLGLVKGDENNCFNPANSTTRAEAATVTYRLLYLN